MPSEEEQRRHALTHLPFKDWCESCVSHRSRANPHKRDDSLKDSGTPTVSFDFCYAKAGEDGRQVRDVDAVCALIAVDSAAGFLAAIPVSKKSEFEMMVRELLSFVQTLGHAKVVLRCDNEPSLKQLQLMTVRARQALGLPTRSFSHAAYNHGNSL